MTQPCPSALLHFATVGRDIQHQETVIGVGQERVPGTRRNHHPLARIDLATSSVDLDLHRPGLGTHDLMKVMLVKLNLTWVRAQRQGKRLGGR